MYSAVELKELMIKPKINDISLEVLREFYFPRTFFVEKLSKPEDKDIYIDKQEKIAVTKEHRIIMI